MAKNNAAHIWAHTDRLEKISFIMFVIASIASIVVAIKEPSLQTISAVITNIFVLALMYAHAIQKARIHHLTAHTTRPH